MLYGIDNKKELDAHLKGKNVALVMNQASVASFGKTTLDVIKEICTVKALFALEHGIRGAFKAGEDVEKEEGEYEIPEISLYHGSGCGLMEEDIKGLDALVYDVQDLGLRFYTYVASLKILVEDCERYGLELIVLDRPCPFGRLVWGNILQDDSFSFVGPDNLTISYGMTPGEVSLWFASRKGHKTLPTVIRLEGWKGEPYWQNGWEWIKPSPNIPDFETAFLYAGMCFIEGCSLSEGRGTLKPFKTFGAPWIDSSLLLKELERYQLPGFVFKETEFKPQDSKCKGTLCHGVEITVKDFDVAEPVRLGLLILSICFNKWKETEELPGTDDLTHMERLIGKGSLSSIIKDPLGVYDEWQKEAKIFKKGGIYIYG